MLLIINDLKQKKIHLISAGAWQGRGVRESTSKHLPVISRPLQSILWVSALPQSCLCLVSRKENGVIRERVSASVSLA